MRHDRRVRTAVAAVCAAGTLLVNACPAVADTPPVIGEVTADVSGPVNLRTALGRRPPGHVEGGYIVTLKDLPRNQVAEFARAMAGRALKHTFDHAMLGFAVRGIPAQVAEAWRKHRNVAAVEPDPVMRGAATQSGATWGLDRVDQRDRPLNFGYTYTATGSGVRVYMIDSGIRPSHLEFEGRAKAGFDAIGDRNGLDCNGHGTHVSGTIGGKTFGVAKGARLIGVRVLDCERNGTGSDVLEGIDWVTANAVKPAVVNMSVSTATSRSSAIESAVLRSIDSGLMYVVSAGNDGKDACTVSPPALPAAFVVAATGSTDARPAWSNFGSCVDMFAPGVSIRSAWYTADTHTSTVSGTSMAAPHVAGVVAKYLELHPSATPSAVATALIDRASTGRVGDPAGSPNRLLYTRS